VPGASQGKVEMGEVILIERQRDNYRGRALMEEVSYLTEALKIIPNRYQLVKIISDRVRQLNRGAKPLIEIGEAARMSLVEIACKEIVEGKLKFEIQTPEAKKAKKKELRGL